MKKIVLKLFFYSSLILSVVNQLSAMENMERFSARENFTSKSRPRFNGTSTSLHCSTKKFLIFLNYDDESISIFDNHQKTPIASLKHVLAAASGFDCSPFPFNDGCFFITVYNYDLDEDCDQTPRAVVLFFDSNTYEFTRIACIQSLIPNNEEIEKTEIVDGCTFRCYTISGRIYTQNLLIRK